MGCDAADFGKCGGAGGDGGVDSCSVAERDVREFRAGPRIADGKRGGGFDALSVDE